MDQATRRQRARNKALARKNADGLAINQIEPRGLGKRNKPADKFSNRQCDYRVGGREVVLRKKRENPKIGQSDFYFIKIVRGGLRCTANELMSGRCLEHLGATYEQKDDE